MTAPGPADEPPRRPALAERPGLVERAAARVVAVVEPLVARILGVPRIAMAHAVYLRFSASSGPVLARGLAYVALFALVPALLAVLSVVGFFVSDPAVRDQIVAIVAEQIPPLGPVIDEALQGFSGLAATTGIISIVLLVWSASSVVRALDGAFRVVFEDAGEGRTPIRDVVAVASVAGGIVRGRDGPGPRHPAGSGRRRHRGPRPGGAQRWPRSRLVTGLVALAYRFVPRPRPGWRMLGLPALGAGLAIFLLTALFGVLGPLLFGSAQLYGAFGALFLGLIWLGNVTQVLLLGAAWVAERDRRGRARGREPSGAAAPRRLRRRRRPFAAGGSGLAGAAAATEAGVGREREAAADAGLHGRPRSARGHRARRREDLLAGRRPDARRLGARGREAGGPGGRGGARDLARRRVASRVRGGPGGGVGPVGRGAGGRRGRRCARSAARWCRRVPARPRAVPARAPARPSALLRHGLGSGGGLRGGFDRRRLGRRGRRPGCGGGNRGAVAAAIAAASAGAGSAGPA